MTRSEPGWRAAVVAAIGASADVRWSAAGASLWARAWRLETGARIFFVKEASGRFADMLDAEADGLRALAATGVVRVPAIVADGSAGDTAFLVLEHFDAGAVRDDAVAWRRAGRAASQAARLTARRASASAGIATTGSAARRSATAGPTTGADSSVTSASRRNSRSLRATATRARCNGEGERLLAALPTLLRGHEPAPSLLHGDLWSGNAAGLPDGTPIVFDPAVYVGDREADVAMAELFGGFGRDFHAAYRDAWPLDDGYPLRRTLYNLYHVLNHLNLFGAGYLAQAERAIGTLLAAAR